MKKREDCFFGLHFDKHATPETKEIGITYPAEIIERICKEIKPDYIQTDAKGLEGLSCYPTKVGNQAPEMKGDILRVWRDVTKKHDIPLYAHFCGVVDKECGRKHPEWSCEELDPINHHVFFGKGSMSIFGPYVDELLIPQIKELAGEYQLEGVWIDAEAIYTAVDVSENAKKAYIKEYGKKPPESDKSENYAEYLDFLRDSFNKYVNYYVREIKKDYPAFEICSNMSMGSSTPDEKEYDIDFCSVDLSGETAIDSVRYETRLMMNRGKPWDCMSWDYRSSCGHANGYSDIKTKAQMCQEAAAVIATGGGYQIYHHMGFYKPMIFEKYAIELFKAVSEFCRAREEFCFKAKSVPDVGVVFSTENYYKLKGKPFERGETDYEKIIMGALCGTLNTGRSVDLILTHQVKDLSNYPILVLPETKNLEAKLKTQLLEYVKNGGTLFLAGPSSIKHFKQELCLKAIAEGKKGGNHNLSFCSDDGVADLHGDYVVVEIDKGEVKDNLIVGEYSKTPQEIIGLFVVPYGKGKIVSSTFNVFLDYANSKNSAIRNLIERAITTEEYNVKIKGTRYVETVLMEKDRLRMLNLINVSGEHGDLAVGAYDEILPIYNIGVEFSCPYRPERIVAQPEGIEIPFKYEDKKVKFTLDRLDIHTVIVAERQ